MKTKPLKEWVLSTNCSSDPLLRSGLKIFCIEINEARSEDNSITGPIILCMKSWSDPAISGKINATKINIMIPVKRSDHLFIDTFKSRRNSCW